MSLNLYQILTYNFFHQVVLPELASIRIAAYEESGKFIGHRVLPVVGLCPGYRHVNLRNELGQPHPLATLFLLVVVKDYVPQGFSELAEALSNPIKYQSNLEKRAQQLAVLTDDLPGENETEEMKKSSAVVVTAKPMDHVSATNGSPPHKHHHQPKEQQQQQQSVVPVGSASLDLVGEEVKEVSAGNSPGMTSNSEQNNLGKGGEVKEEKFEEIVAEPVEKILENKLVKEKKMELDKKLENLRKKHEKKKITLQSQKSGDFGGEKKPKLMNIMFRRISSTNM